jgi:hypothetical protein
MGEEYGAFLKVELLMIALTGGRPSFAVMTLPILMAKEILIQEMTLSLPLILTTSIQEFRENYQIG